ncbi:hypothetical protein LC605_27830 [Nostoc sp. CHAB 5836]|uniref:hypothetical protein n=1 Tax=Nostoc sp. CHAB 5836 TaxID=2780404 RepID=UPI001E43BD7F|nr:hypothetical protein [Nostoc sp. CHAB 5836]MCC5618829.1 hypothetical protein [Nostoc sp. CHAB 5836]
MLNIASFSLPTEIVGDYRAHLTEIHFEENNFAPLVVVNFGLVVAIAVEAAEEITLSTDWENVTAIASNGKTLTPAIDPEDPRESEFLYNPYTNTVRVYGGEGRSLQIYGTTQQIKFSPPLLPPPYPQLFTNLPAKGAIQFNRRFEQQPSAQFELEMTLPKSLIQTIFAPGTEIDLYGLPLRINSLNIKEYPRSIYPNSRCDVSVSLGSRWENYLNEPCFLRSDGKNNLPSNEPFQDPECIAPIPNKSDPNFNVTIQQLLSRIGIAYTGPNLAAVPIPKGTPRDTVVNPVQLLSDRTLIANSFIRWSNAAAVEVVRIDSTRVWFYQEADILGEVETSYEAIAKTSKRRLTSIANYNPPTPETVNFPSVVQLPPVPQLRGELPTALAFEYPNSELTGEFSQIQDKPKEFTQGQKPTYVKKQGKREERVDGDKNAHTPLEGVDAIEVMSLCFDIGGQTKTRSTTTIENGATTKVVDEIWGFAYRAIDIYSEAKGRLYGSRDRWECLKRTTTDYTYDLGTGYLLSTTTSGYNTVRYRQESADNPETLDLTPDDSEYYLYKFFNIPVIGRTSYYLKLMPEYSTEGLFELVKTCNRDGTSTVEPLIDPDYAPPYYVEYERTETTSYASRSNPENEGVTVISGTNQAEDGSPLAPDLYVGEESQFESFTQVTEAVYQEKLIGFEGGYPTYERGEEISPQKFIKYTKQFKAQGQAIASALEEISIEEGTGELPIATRRPSQFIKEQPAEKSTKTQKEEQKYRYFLQTAGYTDANPINGSENFPLAKTLNEALTAARCKLAIENWQNGLTETLQIDGNLLIKEGDRFNYYCNGEFRQRVVLGVQTTLNILGVVDSVRVASPSGEAVAGTPASGVPKVTAATSLTLGRWMTPNLTYNKIPVPKEPKAPGVNITVTNVIDAELGSIIDWARVQSRRNPNP